MARKKTTSRPNLPQEALDHARRQANQPTATQATSGRSKKKTSKAQPAPAVKVTTEDLAKEYAYVISDLRNMGLLAAALFAALILVALFL
jgi:hypothetical protein